MSFTASPIVSPFPDQNALFDPAKAIQTGQTIQQNQLHMQGQQIDLSNANMAQVGQAAAGLLSAYPDEASRAAAYPRVVGMLQSQGYALHAPSEYPGEGVLRSMVNQSIPAADQYKMGLLTSPGQQANFNAVFGTGSTGSTGAPGTPTGTTAAPSSVPIPARGTGGPGASASAPTEWLPYFEEASKETGIPVDLLLAQARQESSFNPNNVGKSGEIGLFQIMPSTARSPGPGMQGVDPATLTGADNVRNNIMFGARYLKAQMGGGDPNNPAVQAAALRRYNGTGPGGDPNYVQHVFGYRPTLAPSDPNAAITAYTPPTAGATTASAAPAGAQPGQPVPTQVAGPPMVSTAPAAPTATPGAPAQPPATAAAPAQPSQPPGAPAPAPTGGTGMQSPQFQRAMQLERQAAMLESGPGGQLPQNKAMADYLHTQAKAILGTDTFVDIGGGMQRNVLTQETKYGGPPTARSTVDNEGNTWVLPPGQAPYMLSRNTSGVTGTGPEASALRTMNEIAPKIQAGIPLTQQELANYSSATEIYRQPVFVENPNTGAKDRRYTRDLPPNFPPPPGSAPAPQSTTPAPPAVPGTAPAAPATTSTAPAPPSASAPDSSNVVPGMAVGTKKSEEQLGTDFAGNDKKAYDASVGSLGMLANANNAAAVMNSTPGSWTATGPAANTRLELAKTVNGVAGLFGLQPPFDPTKVSAWEALTKQTKLMGMQVVNNYFGGSREAASIINGATSAVPNAENSYLGFRLVSSGIEQDLLRQQQLYEYKAQKVAANQPLSTAETEFNQTHPVEMYTARAIANAIPDDLVAKLQANPSKVADFDQHFGPGIGEFILKGGRTQMVAPAQVPR